MVDQTTFGSHAPPSPPFSYTPLGHEEIRLMTIDPGKFDAKISCILAQLNWDEIATSSMASDQQSQPQHIYATAPGCDPSDISRRLCRPTNHVQELDGYEALSYTWDNDASLPHQMLNISLNNRCFQVTENLESALRCLRHESLPRVFWIDAICINQADDVEKEQQVKKMYEIYKNARQVVVWLGPATSDSMQALEFVETIYRCFDPTAEHLEEEKWSEYAQPTKCLRQVESLLTAEYASSWVALHRIFSRR